MSTKALGNIVPGGSAASSALGYRLLTLSGISGPDAGFALATAGLGSAVVLNLLFWIALLISIPLRGVDPLYVTFALAGLGIMLVVALLVLGLQHGQGRAETFLRWLGRKLHFDPDTAAAALRQIGERLEELIADRKLLRWVLLWATLNWLLDAASLAVFLAAFGGTLEIDGLVVAFGLANIAAVLPITPGGLGIVEGIYIPTLVGFGMSRRAATLGVASYRLAQYWFPILLGGVLYATLRVGRGRSCGATASTGCVTSPNGRPPRASGGWSSPCASGNASGLGAHSDDATIANPLVDQIDAGALDALDPPFAEVADDGADAPPTRRPTRPSGSRLGSLIDGPGAGVASAR